MEKHVCMNPCRDFIMGGCGSCPSSCHQDSAYYGVENANEGLDYLLQRMVDSEKADFTSFSYDANWQTKGYAGAWYFTHQVKGNPVRTTEYAETLGKLIIKYLKQVQ